MKLYYSTASPYSRKVRLAIQFKKLDKDIEQVICNPFTESSEETHQNPLGKVPTLILNDGITIFDSPFICEYIDMLSNELMLYPKERAEWISVKRAEALGDGILDAAYNIVMERKRPEGQSSTDCIEQWQTEIKRALNEAEKIVRDLNDIVTQSHISMYCTLGYLDFRLPELNWRDDQDPILSKWYNEFQQEYPSILETKPY